jgi:hypothetical protein
VAAFVISNLFRTFAPNLKIGCVSEEKKSQGKLKNNDIFQFTRTNID